MKFLVMLCISLSSLMATLSYADDHASQQGQAFPVYGMANNFEVSNPAGALAAVRTFMASPAAKAFPGNVIFNEVVADGDMAGTHSLNVFYPSPEAMGQIINSDQPPAEALAFFMSMQASAEPIGSSVFRMLRGHGLSSTSGTLTLIIQLEVTDGASFSKAFDKLWGSDSFQNFPGGVYFGDFMANGDNPSTHWISFVAKDMASLGQGMDEVQGSKDMATYLKDANSFRNYGGRALFRTIQSMAAGGS